MFYYFFILAFKDNSNNNVIFFPILFKSYRHHRKTNISIKKKYIREIHPKIRTENNL